MKDFIGDIHGHADALEALLKKLGYSKKNGAYKHSDPKRSVVFLGDLIDRGPKQLESIDIARRMRDAGNAQILMGNHEFNAIGFYHPHPDPKVQKHLRIRGSKNRAQHKAFIDAIGEDSPLHKEMVDLFTSFSIILEDDYQAVHACWYPDAINSIKPLLDANGIMNSDALLASLVKGDAQYENMEILLKGLEVELPNGFSFLDKGGHERKKSRLQWWNQEALNYRDAVVYEAGLENLPADPLADKDRVVIGEKPIFFGHYWMNGEPHIQGPHAACLDFSIAKDGKLVAYSFDGEAELDPRNLSWV